MSEHKSTVTWRRTGADFDLRSYSRDHDWRFEGGTVLAASAAPQYRGNPQRVDPESAFVAALASCHMLTFLALCARKGIVVDSYDDDAVGHLEKNAQGKLAMTRVELRPRIVFGANAPDAAALGELHQAAHRECFIANSVLTEVSVLPR